MGNRTNVKGRRTLSKVFGIREDRVATRALTDIIGKAVKTGALSSNEQQWASKLLKAIEQSGPDQLVYPKLSLGQSAPGSDPSGNRAGSPMSGAKAAKRGLDMDTGEPAALPSADPSMAASQAAWDSLGSAGSSGNDIELGAAGAAPSQDDGPVPSIKKKGLLSRMFGGGSKKPAKEPKAKADPKPKAPGKAVSQSTWDDLAHSGPKAAEPRAKSSPKNTWDRYANDGDAGDRDAEDEKGPKGRRGSR